MKNKREHTLLLDITRKSERLGKVTIGEKNIKVCTTLNVSLVPIRYTNRKSKVGYQAEKSSMHCSLTKEKDIKRQNVPLSNMTTHHYYATP